MECSPGGTLEAVNRPSKPDIASIRIDMPAPNAVLPPGDHRLAGIAYAGDRGISKVEYTVDGEPGSITLPNHFLGDVTTTAGEDTLRPDPIETACKQLGNLLPAG